MVTLLITAVSVVFFIFMSYMYYTKKHKKDDTKYYVPKQTQNQINSVEDEGHITFEPSQNTDVPAEENDIDYNS